MKVSLKDRQVPRRQDNYPQFATMAELLLAFTEAELCELVNRAIYQLEYQKESHKKYQERQKELEQPIKEAFKQLFPGQSWARATPEMIDAAFKLASGRK